MNIDLRNIIIQKINRKKKKIDKIQYLLFKYDYNIYKNKIDENIYTKMKGGTLDDENHNLTVSALNTLQLLESINFSFPNTFKETKLEMNTLFGTHTLYINAPEYKKYKYDYNINAYIRIIPALILLIHLVSLKLSKTFIKDYINYVEHEIINIHILSQYNKDLKNIFNIKIKNVDGAEASAVTYITNYVYHSKDEHEPSLIYKNIISYIKYIYHILLMINNYDIHSDGQLLMLYITLVHLYQKILHCYSQIGTINIIPNSRENIKAHENNYNIKKILKKYPIHITNFLKCVVSFKLLSGGYKYHQDLFNLVLEAYNQNKNMLWMYAESFTFFSADNCNKLKKILSVVTNLEDNSIDCSLLVSSTIDKQIPNPINLHSRPELEKVFEDRHNTLLAKWKNADLELQQKKRVTEIISKQPVTEEIEKILSSYIEDITKLEYAEKVARLNLHAHTNPAK